MAFLVSPGAAQETAPQTRPSLDYVLRDAGLFGLFAAKCDADPSPANPYVRVIQRSPGIVVEEHDLGPDYAANTYSFTDAERLSKTRVALKAILNPGKEDEMRQSLVVLIGAKTRRTMFNRIDGGAVRVRDGITSVGTRTPVLRKCE